MVEHFDRFGDGWWWPGTLMMLLFLVLIGVGIWAIVRVTSHAPATAGPMLPPPAGRDPALEEVRLLYARGAIDRDEFARRSRDLGGSVPEPDPPPPQTG